MDLSATQRRLHQFTPHPRHLPQLFLNQPVPHQPVPHQLILYQVTLNASNTYEYSAFSWAEFINVTEKGENGGNSTGDSGTEGWDFNETGAVTGGGGSPEPGNNIYISVLTQKFVKAGNRIRFDFIQNATYIDFVVFDAKKTLGKTTTTIEQLNGRSVMAPVELGGTVYRYINIWVGNEDFASSENIENTTI
ncbi:MAG: PGF-pre-PGF domain-containing protein, partial [Bacteroidota bacterium]|nr:PGF-pre-PGF domain-containing protein [Bacteroidota bacterium]